LSRSDGNIVRIINWTKMYTDKSIEAKLNGRLEETCVILTSVYSMVDGLVASATWFGPMIKLDGLLGFGDKLSDLLLLFNLEKMHLAEANGTEYSTVYEMIRNALSIVQSCKNILIEHAAFEHSSKFRDIELRIQDLLKFLIGGTFSEIDSDTDWLNCRLFL